MIAAHSERFRSTCKVQASQILTRLRESEMGKTGGVAGPSRSSSAVRELQVREIGTCVGAPIEARLPPEWHPLTWMVIPHSLSGAHADEYQTPDGHKHDISLSRSQGSAEPCRIEESKKPRSCDPIDTFDRQVHQGHLKKLVIEGRHPGAAQQLVQHDRTQSIKDTKHDSPQLRARRSGRV